MAAGQLDDRGQPVAVDDRPGRVRRAADHDRLGAWGDGGGQRIEVGLVAVRGGKRVGDPLGAAQLGGHPVVGIAGIGDQELVAGLQHAQQAAVQGSHGADGDDDLLARDADAVVAVQSGGERLAQLRQAGVGRVAGMALLGGAVGGRDDVRRGREVRLADLQVDDAGALREVHDLADARARHGRDAGIDRSQGEAPVSSAGRFAQAALLAQAALRAASTARPGVTDTPKRGSTCSMAFRIAHTESRLATKPIRPMRLPA